MTDKQDKIHTKIWQEIPNPNNPFVAETCLCSGFDVYGDLLGRISWIQYLYLLFKLEPPTSYQSQLLEVIAVAIANPGPRDLSVRAAMNGGAAESKAAAALIAALASGAGQFGGARELYLSMQLQSSCMLHEDWLENIKNYTKPEKVEAWPDIEHVPGFDPYNDSCSQPVKQTLEILASTPETRHINWVKQNLDGLEKAADSALSMVGVISAAFLDLDFTPDQGEMAFLLLRLPGAAVHSLEQREHGLKNYPFFRHGLTLTNDPGPKSDK